MKNIIPLCPECESNRSVGKVRTYSYKESRSTKGYFCSSCLTEFSEKGEILVALWGGCCSLKRTIS